jgi:leucyl-tRNA synthetase
MSKSRGNVIGIDETVENYGVDAMRLFLLKAAPPEDALEWTDEGIVGRVRFIQRVWRACEQFAEAAGATSLATLPAMKHDGQRALVRALHLALKSAHDETETRRFHYNVTTARLDELVNLLTSAVRNPAYDGDPAVLYTIHALPLALAPFAPHIADELWSRMGHTTSIHLERFPEPDPAALTVDAITVVVQVNGKVRGRLLTRPGIDEEAAYALAVADSGVRAHTEGKTVRKRIFVPDKLLNIVVQ